MNSKKPRKYSNKDHAENFDNNKISNKTEIKGEKKKERNKEKNKGKKELEEREYTETEEELEEDKNIYSVIIDNKKSIIISFIIVFGLIFVILMLAGINDVVRTLKRTNLWILALTFVIQTFVYLFWALRWKLILDKMHQAPRFLNILGILMTSIFGNNITPGSIGGEPLRAYILKEYNETPFEIGLASTMADRVFELLPFLLMSIVAVIALLSWHLYIVSKILLIILILFTIFLFSIVIYAGINKSVSEKIVLKLLDWIHPIVEKITNKKYNLENLREKAMYYIDNFNSSFTMIVENKLFIGGALLALVTWGLDLFNSYLSFIAIGVTPPLAPFITIYTIAILLSFLPLLPGSLGITEIIMIALFVPVGITANYVLAASAIERISSYIIPTIIGLLVAIYYARKIVKKNNPKDGIKN
jgi:glycosyltransferase 2 family protein